MSLKNGGMLVRHAIPVHQSYSSRLFLNRDIHARWATASSKTKRRQMGTNFFRPSHGITFGLPDNWQQTHGSIISGEVLAFYQHGRPAENIFNVA